MKRIICISGDAASGKTTAARLVLEALPGWEMVSTGAWFRAYCAERDIDPQQIPHLGDDIHRQADAAVRARLASEQHLLAESRLAGYLSRDFDDALRIFCECPLEERAARFYNREVERRAGLTAEEAVRLVSERDTADTANLQKLYGIDYHDPAYYHLRLSTLELNPQQVAAEILAAARK